MPILKIMEVMGVQVSPKGMAYAQTYNDHRIMRAEKETSDASKLIISQSRKISWNLKVSTNYRKI